MRQRPDLTRRQETLLWLIAVVAGTCGVCMLLMDAGIWISQHIG